MNDTRLFAFESDFVATLRCVPMAVRFKLDRCGVKLSLRQWSRFTVEDRHRLLLAPCETQSEADSYRATLVALIAERTGEVAVSLPEPSGDEWRQSARTPNAVACFAVSIGLQPLSDRQWRSLSDLERFALLKLSRDNHDNVNFLPALREFNLQPAMSADTIDRRDGPSRQSLDL